MISNNSYSRSRSGEDGGRSRGNSNGGSPSSSSPSTFSRGSAVDDGSGIGSGIGGAFGDGLPPLSPIDGNQTQRQRQYRQHQQQQKQWRGMGPKDSGSPGASGKITSNDLGGGGSSYHRHYEESPESCSGGLSRQAGAAAAAAAAPAQGGVEAFTPGGSELELDAYGHHESGEEEQPYGYSHQHCMYMYGQYNQHNQQEEEEEEGDHFDTRACSSNDGGPRRLQLQMEGEENSSNNGKFEIDLSPNSSSSYGNGNGNGGKVADATSPHHHHHHQQQQQQQQQHQTFFYSSSSAQSVNDGITSSLTNSSALTSSTSFHSSSFADGSDGSGSGSSSSNSGIGIGTDGTAFPSAKRRRYEYAYGNDDGHDDADRGQSMGIHVTPPVPVPSPSSYRPDDNRFWSFSVGKYAHPRSCHERFGHAWPLTDRDRAVWTRRDFAFSSKVLGSGNFGEVRLVRCRDDSAGANSGSSGGSSSSSRGTVLAIKTISKEEILKSQKGIAIARREIEIQTRLHHPNILGCEGYFHDNSSLYLVLEYANGRDLFALFKKQQMMLANDRRRRLVYGDSDDDDNGDDDQYVATLPHSLAARITQQVAQALLYLESKNVAHRDIKPENIMLHYTSSSRDDPMNAQIKLVDFGWASWCHFPSGHRHFTLCGTPEYIAPEILTSCLPEKPRLSTMVGGASSFSNPMSMGYDARYVDAWSLGVMIFELISNETPFSFPAGRDDKDDDNRHIFAAIQRFEDDDLESLHVGRDVPHEWRLFGRIVRGLLRTNPMERLSMKQVLDHPWLKV